MTGQRRQEGRSVRNLQVNGHGMTVGLGILAELAATEATGKDTELGAKIQMGGTDCLVFSSQREGVIGRVPL